jgi:hypothetical protein
MSHSTVASLLATLLLGAACSPSAGTNAGCRTQGLFTDQSSCVSASGGSCEMTTLQSSTDSKSLVCWKPSFLGLSGTGSGTGTSTTGGCSGVYPWDQSGWSPKECDGVVKQLTQTVTCSSVCPCNSPAVKPATVSPCTNDLYNGQHSVAECKKRGGSAIPTPTGDMICSLPGSSCPTGWFAYGPMGVNWTATLPASAQEHTNCTGGRFQVFTGSHQMGESQIEFKTYCGSRNCFKCKRWDTVYATVVRVGCF